MNRKILFLMSAALLLHLSLYSAIGACEEKEVNEYEVKAAFLYNFAKFVDFPEKPAGSSLNLCVAGSSPLVKELEKLQGKAVKDKVLAVRQTRSTGELKDCHILFICSTEKWHLNEILEAVQGAGVLTVGDSGRFAGKGVVINFYVENKKIRFEINIDAVKRNRLNISSQLLRLAKIVHDEQQVKR